MSIKIAQTPKPVGVVTDLPQPGSVPPLQSGDHLSRAEFERRYQAHPEIKKAELIEGLASPEHVAFKARPRQQSQENM